MKVLVNSCNEIEKNPFYEAGEKSLSLLFNPKAQCCLDKQLTWEHTHTLVRLGSVSSVLILSSHICSVLINGILYTFLIEFLI